MKELSFFLLKNSFGAKMRKGFKNFCNGDGSTSTLNQHQTDSSSCMATQSPYLNDSNAARGSRQPTLEEMILQLDLEEKMARRAKLDEYGEIQHHRMSCVNSSDILRSARNALNQYPRFSLDGKDAMYRSSFRNLGPVSTGGRRKGFYKVGLDSETRRLPAKLAGESVVWCKPGVVGKLMGLEAMPMPVNIRNSTSKERLGCMIKKQNLRRRAERHEVEMEMEMERRRVVVETSGSCGGIKRGMMNGNVRDNNNNNKMMGGGSTSCSTKGGYCVMKPELPNDEAGWPMKRFR